MVSLLCLFLGLLIGVPIGLVLGIKVTGGRVT
jgi:hypothetical protein